MRGDMKNDEREQLERISALADGQLAGDELAQTMAWVASSEEARVSWHAYHVIGDALRSADLTDCSRDRVFAARLRERLTRLDPIGTPVDAGEAAGSDGAVAMPLPGQPTPVVAPVVADTAVRGANDAVVRWKWLTAAASLMAVAVLGWHLGQVNTGASTQLAAAPSAGGSAMSGGVAAAAPEPAVMLRDPRLDELLAAHRRFGGASALQMPAGFLRNATFEQPGR